MNKREWLASQGLAEIGKRGRFSREAEAAWESYNAPTELDGQITIEEVIEELPRDGVRLATLPPVYNKVRDVDSLYTIDDAGRMINHLACGDCKRNANYCECEGGPGGLSYIQPKQKAYVVTL